jgi:hypothetical protein
MNKLVACALLGFGLTQVLVGCSDDDDATPGGSGTAGSSHGGNSSGSSNGGSSSAGRAGSATGGAAGTSTGGNATAGSAGKGGSATAGTTSGGGEGGMAGGAGVAGDTSVAGGGGMAGAGGADPGPPQLATELWLSHFCEAKSMEELACTGSQPFGDCYDPYRRMISTVGFGGICEGEGEVENEPTPKTDALVAALDALAAACPDPDVDQWRCALDGEPQAIDTACRAADEARRTATMNCGDF